MSDDTVIYEYKPVPGSKPFGIPTQDLTARHLERLAPEQRREVEAFAKRGEFFHAVNKSTATRTVNQIRRDEVAEAKADAAAMDKAGDN